VRTVAVEPKRKIAVMTENTVTAGIAFSLETAQKFVATITPVSASAIDVIHRQKFEHIFLATGTPPSIGTNGFDAEIGSFAFSTDAASPCGTEQTPGWYSSIFRGAVLVGGLKLLARRTSLLARAVEGMVAPLPGQSDLFAAHLSCVVH